ncbi:hypothetical protein BJ742DRAFT_821492 [Cladochytrium replicatum]|nr:hypothetical protein BJ742DRAFT_821492 [Cladochytrium replicatum]
MKKPVVDAAPKRVKEIQFGVFSAQEARKLAVFELYERNLYDISRPNRPPARGGVLDRRLGTPDKISLCETCNQNIADCVGHYGVIRLVLPVFHIGYFRLIMTVLQNICKNCGRLLLEEQKKRSYLKRMRRPDIDGVQRKDILKGLNSACKKVTMCPHCHSANGSLKKVGALKIVHDKFKKKTKAMTAEEDIFRQSFETMVKADPTIRAHVSKAQDDLSPLTVLRLFQKISAEDCEVMGLDPEKGRPELFIWTALPVPPIALRPSIGQENASNEDDLTVLLSDIVQTNVLIEKMLADGEENFLEHWDWLQISCSMYVNSDLPGIPSHLQGQVRKIKKGFVQRLKGKNGRIRGNLSGKRVDYSGRTVISPDPNCRIDQLAVPMRIAMKLTYPERVTAFNIEKLRQCILNGDTVHPGAIYVTSTSMGKKFGISNKHISPHVRKQMAEKLQFGDVVDRHLNDGDIVLFNRQPSLHKLSIMSHFVKVRPWRTLRFNECVCTPYNADFDGDEMNLHVPQTEEARTEAMVLMGVKNNLVTPRNGEPLVAATQDFITASYLLTRKDQYYDRSQVSQICCYMFDAAELIELPPPAIVKPLRLWTGKQIFSLLLRPHRQSPIILNLETKTRNVKPPSNPSHNAAGMKFDPCMDLIDGWMVIRNSELLCGVVDKGTIGDGSKKGIFYTALRDFGPEHAAALMNRVAKCSARWLANQGFSIGIDDVQPGEQLRKEKESTVEEANRKCEELIEKMRQGKLECDPGCTEEQTLEAKVSGILSKVRDDLYNTCEKELHKYNAPLNMSLCGSKGSKINVSQMVACVGQQIISGKRVGNGFGDRSLPHFPKYSKIPAAKGFVRNSFFTGLTPPEFFFHAMSGREGLVDTAVKTAETGYMQRRLVKALEDLTAHYDNSVRNSLGTVVQFTYGDDALDPTNIEGDNQPVEFERNLKHCQAIYDSDAELPKKSKYNLPKLATAAPLLPWQIRKIVQTEISLPRFQNQCSAQFLKSLSTFIEDKVAKRLANVRSVHGIDPALDEPPQSAAKGKEKSINDESTPEGLKLRYTENQIRGFLRICHDKYSKAKIEAGTAVGAVGAQSIGEPGTQMTLKTFHFAGVASMNVTLGVPRIKEIINASKTISTPIIQAHLEEKLRISEKSARVVKGRIEKTTLEDVAEYMQECIDTNECSLLVKINMETIRRLQLEVTLNTIRWAIIRAPKLKIPEGDVGTKSPDMIRVRISVKDSRAALHAIQALKRQLMKVVIKGIPTISRAVVNKGEKGQTGINLLVEGAGLLQVMGIAGVDGLKTKSNSTLEVFKVLGIEAARNTIINEIIYTMESHGMTIDRRHVMLLGDVMTYKGEPLGITRTGIAKMKDSVLMLASFEKTTDHLFDASFYGKRDMILGVSECIIMGVPMGIGTGLFKLIQQMDDRRDGLPGRRSLLFDSSANEFHLPL